jgi:hypothetical protein
MTILHGTLFFIATFAQVFLLGFQSRNVNTSQYASAGCTSFLIGAAQIFTVRSIALSDPWVAFAITSVAGPSAIVSAMFVHRRLFKRV